MEWRRSFSPLSANIHLLCSYVTFREANAFVPPYDRLTAKVSRVIL